MSDNSTSGNITLAILGTAFVVLKLCHVIDWSWWWVTAPFWGPAGLAIAVLTAAAIGAGFRIGFKK